VGCKESDSLIRGEASISEPCQDSGDAVCWLWHCQIGAGMSGGQNLSLGAQLPVPTAAARWTLQENRSTGINVAL